MPSERAVFWFALSESVLVSERPSGASWTAPFAPQAPGIWFTGSAGDAFPVRVCWRGVLVAEEVAADPGIDAWMVTSGITSDTDGSVFSRASSPLDTVAARALTRL